MEAHEQIICSECGAANPASSQYCSVYNARLSGSPVRASTPAPSKQERPQPEERQRNWPGIIVSVLGIVELVILLFGVSSTI
jgi:hypothetical protein